MERSPLVSNKSVMEQSQTRRRLIESEQISSWETAGDSPERSGRLRATPGVIVKLNYAAQFLKGRRWD